MATHSSIHAWRIPWTEEPGGLQSLGLQRVGHDRQNQLGGEPLPTTGTKQGALPVTGEQAACIASIVGAVVLTSCLIIWQKKRRKEKEGNIENFKP